MQADTSASPGSAEAQVQEGAVKPPTPRVWSDPPGGMLMWIVVALELFTFSMVFVLVAKFRVDEPETFAAGQRLLHSRDGLILTILLLTSGWLVSEAVHAVRLERLRQARRYYAAGVGVGLLFVVLKAIDFANKTGAGMSLADDFGSAYLLATGFHFIHVLVGLLMLAHVGLKIGRRPFEDPETAVAGTGLFWHMCDLAWLFLFPLFFV